MGDSEELVELLCTRIRMIMEDASIVALKVGATAPAGRSAAIAELHRAIRTAERLIEAVKAATA